MAILSFKKNIYWLGSKNKMGPFVICILTVSIVFAAGIIGINNNIDFHVVRGIVIKDAKEN